MGQRSRVDRGRVLLCLAVLFLVLAPGATAQEPEPKPHTFWGSVTAAGQSVASGTVVTAWVHDGSAWTLCGTATTLWDVDHSVYAVRARGDSPNTPAKDGANEGDTIRFEVAGEVVPQTGIWHEASQTNVDLHRSGALPTVTTVPSDTPTPTPTRTATPSNTPIVTPTHTATPSRTPAPSGTPSHDTPTTTPTLASGQERVVLQDGAGGYQNTEDTYLSSWETEVNGDKGKLTARSGGISSPLIRFDLSSLPSQIRVEYATLELYPYAGGALPATIQAYAVLRPWEEMSATWHNATSSEAWLLEGCNSIGSDREGIAAAAQIVDAAEFWYSWDVTELVRAWLQNPGANWGVVLIGTPGGLVHYSFSSSEYYRQDQRPRLSITFVQGTPGTTTTPTSTATPGATVTPTNTPTSGPTATPSNTVAPATTPTMTPSPGSGGMIQGWAWEDIEPNEQWDDGEPPFAFVSVLLDRYENLWLYQAIQPTGADGHYAFANLPEGYYRVRVTIPHSYSPTTPYLAIMYVRDGDVMPDVNFGLRRLTSPGATPTATPTSSIDVSGATAAACDTSYVGNTTGAPLQVSQYQVSHGVWYETGPEAIYTLILQHNADLWAGVSDMSADLDVFILSAPRPDAAIAAGDEVALVRNVPAGTYYILVDGYKGASGAYSLYVGCEAASTPTPAPWDQLLSVIWLPVLLQE